MPEAALTNPHTQSERQHWLGLLARSAPEQLAQLAADLPQPQLLRAPEIGAVMVQGRIGTTGAAFNLGEMTVTRCSVRLAGAVGHAMVQGRDRQHALRAATLDALLQTADAPRIHHEVLAPLAAAEARDRQQRAGKAAATKVDFFTLVRGEDA